MVDRGQPSGIVINGLLPNIYFTNMNIANIWEGGLRIQNKPVSLTLFGKKSFTLCVVMRLWLNRSMYIKTFMRNEADEKPRLIYHKTTKKLTLQTNGLKAGSTNETSITLLNSFNDKRVVFWLTKKGTGGDLTVKASISNHSATLTLSSALASQSNYTFRTVGLKCRSQVTGQVTGYRPQVTGHRSQVTRENCSGLMFYYTKIK